MKYLIIILLLTGCYNSKKANKAIAYAAIVGFIISKLTVNTPAATERVLTKIEAGTSPIEASKTE